MTGENAYSEKVPTSLWDGIKFKCPEDGFSKDEVTEAVNRGFTEASLGPRILRTETAPIAAISIIQYELGDIG